MLGLWLGSIMLSMANTQESPRQTAYKFLQSNESAALCTISPANRPHAAMVNYLSDNKLNIYFVALVTSRQYQNLCQNPLVSMLVVQQNTKVLRSIQLSGRAKRIDDQALEQATIETLSGKTDKHTPLPLLLLFNQGTGSELVAVKIVPFEMTIGTFSRKIAGQHKPFFTPVIANRA